jgi:two-component system cell cycle sensor histidine kinase/response regulator CckA
MVRDLMRKILEREGFSVMVASSGEDALTAFFAHDGPIRLVIADLVMGRMGGRELVERLHNLRPETKAMYMSGYARATIASHGHTDPGVPLLEKPFTPDTVIEAVRALLDESDSAI